MKFVILLSLVAFCYAVPFPMKSIDFTEDGKIVITEPTGKRVTIYKNMGPTGSRSFQIQVEGPNFPTKSVVIDEDPHKSVGEHKDISAGGRAVDIVVDSPYFPKKVIHVDNNHVHDHIHHDHESVGEHKDISAGGRAVDIVVDSPYFPKKVIHVDNNHVHDHIHHDHESVGVHKDIWAGGRAVDIVVDSPYFPKKVIHVDKNHVHDHIHHDHEHDHHHDHHYDHNKVYSTGKDSSGHEVEKRSSKLSTKPVSQSELLDELLKEFQGALTDKEYEKLLSKVYKYVKSGDLDPVVYEMLFEMTVTPVDPADKKLNTEISPASPIYPIYRNWMNYKMSLVNDKIGAKTPYDHPLFGYNRPAYGYDTPAYGHGSPAYGYERPAYGYERPAYGYERPAYGYERPAYGYERPAYGYERPAYGYDRPAYGYERPAYGYDRPAYGYERPTYGFTGAHTPVERVPYQAPYHYGPYSQDYQRTTYEGVAHPTYNHPVTAH